jgi:hypothetical protein
MTRGAGETSPFSMTKRLLDFNPVTGERMYFEYSHSDDKMVISHEQDVQSALDYSHAKAADTDLTRKGIKNDLWHYARVPNIVIMEMKEKHGVEFFNKNHSKRVFELLNTEYKHCKTTDKTHNVR